MSKNDNTGLALLSLSALGVAAFLFYDSSKETKKAASTPSAPTPPTTTTTSTSTTTSSAGSAVPLPVPTGYDSLPPGGRPPGAASRTSVAPKTVETPIK